MGCPCESPPMCRNEMGQGLAQRPMIVEVSHNLRGDSWGCVPRSLFWQEDLDRDGEQMAFRNFIYTENDDDLAFLPKDPSPGFGTGSPSTSVNTKLPKDVKEPEV
ncbi:hypothetical protein Tco_1098838 [Tanacetum coccineum]